MAPATTTIKKPLPLPSERGTLLSFFKKETTSVDTGFHASQTRIKNEVVSVELTAGPSKPSQTRNNSSEQSTIRRGKGKEKQQDHNGSAHDPVVISDDDEDDPLPATPSSSSKRRKISVPSSYQNQAPQRSSRQSPNRLLKTPTIFAGCPDFKPPPKWPHIVNIADVEEDDDDEIMLVSDEDATRTQDPGEGEIEEDDSGVEMGDNDRSRTPEMQATQSGEDIPAGEMGWEEPDEGMGMEDEVDDADDAQSAVSSSIKSLTSTSSSRTISSFSFSILPPEPPQQSTTKGPNAFSLLMSGHKEHEQWKDAEADLRRDGKRFAGRRRAPFYKVLTGMPVAVDAFRYGAIPGVTAYLLTHAHSDHYTNLSKSWNNGPIYCSETTANLIIHMLEVDPKWVHGLPNDVPFEMPNTGGVTVTPIEANHCPGSSIFLFEGRQTVNAGDSGFASPYVGSKRVFRYLHCGDFRANPQMVLHPAIARAPINTCYLDTTYLNPKYCFPPQPLVINACATLARRHVVGESEDAPSLEAVQQGSVIGVSGMTSTTHSGGRKVTLKTENGGEREIEVEVKEEKGEKEKQMMQGWLVKKEEKVKEEVKEESGQVGKRAKSRTLVVVGTYSIGKERIVKAIAKAVGSKIYCDQRKKGILLCQTDPELHSMLTSDPIEAQVHLLPLGNIQLDRLQSYLTLFYPHFDRVLGFRPTGWSYSPPAGTDMLPDVNTVIRRDQARRFGEQDLKTMRGSSRNFMMYGVPYSEHSSFFELTCFALSLPGADLKMIATVNVGNEKKFEKWLAEKARRKEKGLPSTVEYRDETFW
ncbi:DNA cross-link repair 1A protein [Cryptococcus deuterogattii 99/473]|uniref:DNA cross-link repair 1A protein n=1 Tax=Cryptococcus deuterogattii Ram5 TaxID=1296110 RepID=A0A0D0U1P6_9TREE|nr:DNA cross-link repair 1A protein [Cryptococcus deuterogattii Ram5]KIR98837.1 DNA cross-link repair 1A protein [Cryptococcus deuterogattii 2001/935-1]KIY55988.1 DNA cross-link repair 1A protein [Cryptococcus deuterogattii 99/473]